MKRKRKARTFDAAGADLGAIDTNIDPFSTSTPFDPGATDAGGGPVFWNWIPSPDPNMMQATVPTGTPFPSDLVYGGQRNDYPTSGNVTYYAATAAAIARGKINAAVETVQATAEDIAAAAKKALDYGPLILLAVAALFLFSKFGR